MAPEKRPAWGWIVLAFLGGFLITAAPYVLAGFVESKFGAWEALLSSTLNNVGVALVLLALAFLLEPKFTRKVSTAAAAAAEDAAEKVVERSNAGLSARVEELEGQIAGARAEAAVRGAELAADVLAAASFSSITAALEEANEIRALKRGWVVVPAGAYDAPRFRFSWAPAPAPDADVPSHMQDADDYVPALVIEHLPKANDGEHYGGSRGQVTWSDDEGPADVIRRLGQAMVDAGHADETSRVNEKDLFTNFAVAIQDALAARHASRTAWFKGQLYEWVDETCVVTTEGLEFRGGTVVPASDFPPHQVPGPTGKARKAEQWPERPSDVDEELWTVALRRGAEHLRRSSYPSGSYNAFHTNGVSGAYTKSNSPRAPQSDGK